jgi:hypothetical protein
MLRNHRTCYLVVCFALVLAAGSAAVARAASAAEPTEPTAGFSTAKSLVESTAEVKTPEGIDGEVELNPVDAKSLEDLAALRSSNDPVFKKYARLPFCTTSGCPGGIDHLAAGTGLRNTGFGTIRLRGVPPGAVATAAFLYYSYIQGGPIALVQNVVFNGTTVTAFFVNNQLQPCWNGAGTLRTYRAAVLPNLLPPINGDYSVSGIPSNLTNGQDPWNPTSTTLPLAEGASLVVLYTHSSVPVGTWVQIHHPATPAVFGTLTFSHFLSQPLLVAARRHTRIAADGQVGGSLNNFNAITNETTSLAGPTPQPFVQIRGNGSYGSGSEDSDLNGTDGEPLNQLWDTHTMNVPGTITPPVTSYRVRYVTPNDCIDPVVHVLTAQ